MGWSRFGCTYRCSLTLAMNKHDRVWFSRQRSGGQFFNIHLAFEDMSAQVIVDILSSDIEILAACSSLLDRGSGI